MVAPTKPTRLRTIDDTVPIAGPEKQGRIDLGLAVLSAVAQPGTSYTRTEIAAFCGCTGTAIWRIETNALRKLRARLTPAQAAALREFLS